MITSDLVKKFPAEFPLFLNCLPLSTSTHQLRVNLQENILVDMLQCFHLSMEQQLSSVCTSLSSINECMDSLEGRQKSLEEEVRANSSLPSSSISTPEPRSGVHWRVTSTLGYTNQFNVFPFHIAKLGKFMLLLMKKISSFPYKCRYGLEQIE